MEFYEVVRTRRSVREYRPDPIPDQVLNRVLDAARIAPSGSNRQPTRVILVADRERKEKVARLCHEQAFISTAPMVAIACGQDIRFNRGDWMGRYAVIVDVTIAVDHLTLAARAEGLGTCWIGSFNGPALKEFLGLPEDAEVVAVTPLGYPTGDPFTGPEGRIPLDEFVKRESWGWDG